MISRRSRPLRLGRLPSPAVASPASEPLRDQSGMEYAIFIQRTRADYSITVFNLAGINVVDLFAAVLLTDPSR